MLDYYYCDAASCFSDDENDERSTVCRVGQPRKKALPCPSRVESSFYIVFCSSRGGAYVLLRICIAGTRVYRQYRPLDESHSQTSKGAVASPRYKSLYTHKKWCCCSPWVYSQEMVLLLRYSYSSTATAVYLYKRFAPRAASATRYARSQGRIDKHTTDEWRGQIRSMVLGANWRHL